MKVLLVTTSDRGGAGKACVRLHQGLLKKNIDAKLLLLQKSNSDIPESYSFLEAFHKKTLFQRLVQKIKIRRLKKKHQKQLRGRPPNVETFRFPNSPYALHEHPLFDWADIVNFHWMADFLDYPSFFKSYKKTIVWTLHDLLPFSGGYPYRIGFHEKEYQHLVNEILQIKTRALEAASLHIVVLNEWMKH